MSLPLLALGLGLAVTLGPAPCGGATDDTGSRIAQAFAALDDNHDGALKREEMVRHADRLIAVLDANADGAVARDEFIGTSCGPASGRRGVPQRMFQIREARFQKLDANGDGKLTADELQTAQVPVVLDIRNVNCDGRITLDELETPPESRRHAAPGARP